MEPLWNWLNGEFKTKVFSILNAHSNETKDAPPTNQQTSKQPATIVPERKTSAASNGGVKQPAVETSSNPVKTAPTQPKANEVMNEKPENQIANGKAHNDELLGQNKDSSLTKRAPEKKASEVIDSKTSIRDRIKLKENTLTHEQTAADSSQARKPYKERTYDNKYAPKPYNRKPTNQPASEEGETKEYTPEETERHLKL